MFERYTGEARRVIFFARYEACHYGSAKIEVEHLLLGLLREEQALSRWLPNTDTATLRKRIGEALKRNSPLPTSVDLPLAATAKHVLKLAADEADRLANKNIGTEHLLLGLCEERGSLASQLLQDGGANAAKIRANYAYAPEPPKPWSFQRASYRDYGFRTLSSETVTIHGFRWNIDYVRDAVELCRSYNWHWHRAKWEPRDVVVHRKTGSVSFDIGLAENAREFRLVSDGWKKDYCFICHWELFQANDEHGTGYTNGHDWLCTECYEKFWQNPDFFSSSQPEIT
jgi:hypothetical protein